ncbi:MAG: deoxyribodipyrimidine photo-lyase [Flavobacteriaceae bacterium]|jgi:deoxyribodipyrimidine photo-lyase|tara:strand:+ start:4452 stop:5753 length:1302 start_codon:yes stop_codon:yes gene_type:complete
MKTALVWLRNDLRFQNQQSFFKACEDFDRVVAYYTFEPKDYEDSVWGFKKTGQFRAKFLLETLHTLKGELEQNNISFIVEKRTAVEGIPFWIKQLEAKALFFQKEWTQEETLISDAVCERLSDKVEIISHYDQFLFHPEDIPMEVDSIPQVFTAFRKKCEKYSEIKACIETPKILDDTSLLEDTTSIPVLEDFGFSSFETHPNTAFPFKGGTASAGEHLDQYFWNTKRLSYYKQTRNGLMGTNYSSKFSPWLANGSLSPRMIYWEVMRYEKEIDKNDSTYWLIFELIWRDYFKYISLKHGNSIFHLGGILAKDYSWNLSHKSFQNWINGKTIEPFVNANMIELKKTGFMSNRGRQNVASFFAKNMMMDWRMGAAYFEHKLIDYDVHSNWGNWMYLAGVGNDPRDRKFNVKRQAERYDPKGQYQKLWLQNILFE